MRPEIYCQVYPHTNSLGRWFSAWFSGLQHALVEAVAGFDVVVQLLVGVLDDVSVELHPLVDPKRP